MLSKQHELPQYLFDVSCWQLINAERAAWLAAPVKKVSRDQPVTMHNFLWGRVYAHMNSRLDWQAILTYFLAQAKPVVDSLKVSLQDRKGGDNLNSAAEIKDTGKNKYDAN